MRGLHEGPVRGSTKVIKDAHICDMFTCTQHRHTVPDCQGDHPLGGVYKGAGVLGGSCRVPSGLQRIACCQSRQTM